MVAPPEFRQTASLCQISPLLTLQGLSTLAPKTITCFVAQEVVVILCLWAIQSQVVEPPVLAIFHLQGAHRHRLVWLEQNAVRF